MSELLDTIVRDVKTRTDALLPAVKEHELLTQADRAITSVIGVRKPEPKPEPEPEQKQKQKPEPLPNLIINTNRRRAIEQLSDGEWNLWTFKRKSDETYRWSASTTSENYARAWLKGQEKAI